MITTKETVTTMTDFVNNFSHDNKEFCELMSREHRYLQEEFTRLCLEWIATCGSDDYRFDGRNEYSHVICKELCKHFCH